MLNHSNSEKTSGTIEKYIECMPPTASMAFANAVHLDGVFVSALDAWDVYHSYKKGSCCRSLRLQQQSD
jgi:hypothetical protein